jgi:hypothetical protein
MMPLLLARAREQSSLFLLGALGTATLGLFLGVRHRRGVDGTFWALGRRAPAPLTTGPLRSSREDHVRVEALVGRYGRTPLDYFKTWPDKSYYKGLRSYKAKFEPGWEERFLVYEHGHRGVLRTALALGRICRA